MRSPKEVSFRLQQEIANAVLLFSQPRPQLGAQAPLEGLPSPQSVADAVRGTDYVRELIKLADQVLLGRIPIFDSEIDYGPAPAWRRDPLRRTETPSKYFRFIPYLDLAAAGDHKWIWEVNRHQHLVLLAQAFVLTGKQAYCDEVVRQLDLWWSDNPFQRGINWTSALEVGFRALSWIWIWHLLGEKLPPHAGQGLLLGIYRHALHLQYNLSIYFSPNTHLLGEAVALHAIGRLFPEFPQAQYWRKLGRDIVRAQMKAQVKKDGSHFEQSTYYHVYALDFFLLYAALEEVDDHYRDGLARMAEFLATIVDEEGNLPLLGDDDGGRLFHPYGKRSQFARATLATASLMLGHSLFPYSERDIEEIALWWLGPEKCKTVEPSSYVRRQSRVFADSGLVVMKRGNASVLFDAGPFGPWSAGHSHADTLSLVVSADGEEILIDPGTYTYLDPDWRDAFRGTAAHNTIRIDYNDQAKSAGPFRWLEKPEVSLIEFSSTAEGDYALAVCRYRRFTHKRIVELGNDGELHVTDELDGPPGEHLLEQFWHLGAAALAVSADLWRIAEVAELRLEGGECEEVWRSRGFGSKEISSMIVVRRRVTFPAALRTQLRLLNPRS